MPMSMSVSEFSLPTQLFSMVAISRRWRICSLVRSETASSRFWALVATTNSRIMDAPTDRLMREMSSWNT